MNILNILLLIGIGDLSNDKAASLWRSGGVCDIEYTF